LQKAGHHCLIVYYPSFSSIIVNEFETPLSNKRVLVSVCSPLASAQSISLLPPPPWDRAAMGVKRRGSRTSEDNPVKAGRRSSTGSQMSDLSPDSPTSPQSHGSSSQTSKESIKLSKYPSKQVKYVLDDLIDQEAQRATHPDEVVELPLQECVLLAKSIFD
jgi:hypothetical protein